MKKKTVSVIIPVYNESHNLKKVISVLRKVTCEIINYNWQYIFVDDGSSDDSLDILQKEALNDPLIKVISLSRNFGKEIALTAGLESLENGSVIFMDSDLQHPPGLIPELIKEWEKGAAIVATIRNSIEDRPVLKRLGSWFFYEIINRISDTKMQTNTTDFRLLDEKVVNVLKTFTERTRMVRGLIDWMGFKKVFVEFDAPARHGGEEGYSYRKLIRLAMNSLSSFSLFPLRLTGYLGLLIIAFSGILLSAMLLNEWIFHWTAYTSLAMFVVGNTFLIGLVLCGLGMLAMYIGNIHTEVINRPLYIIKNRINLKPLNSMGDKKNDRCSDIYLDERRKHRRIKSKGNVATDSGFNSSREYEIIDISRGGISIHYNPSCCQITKTSELKINIACEGGHLQNLTFKVIYESPIDDKNVEVDKEEDKTIIRCGGKLIDLTLSQKEQLDSLMLNQINSLNC